MAAAAREAARVLLRQAELELRLLKKLGEAHEELEALARRRAERALEICSEQPRAESYESQLPLWRGPKRL